VKAFHICINTVRPNRMGGGVSYLYICAKANSCLCLTLFNLPVDTENSQRLYVRDKEKMLAWMFVGHMIVEYETMMYKPRSEGRGKGTVRKWAESNKNVTSREGV